MWSFVALGLAVVASATPPLMVVDLMANSPSIQDQITVQVCAGLFNRDESVAGPVYTLRSADDVSWLTDLESISNPGTVPIPDFIAKCLRTVAKGYIRYDYSAQQIVVPNLITLAAVLDAVPLEEAPETDLPLLYDVQEKWAGWTALEATTYMYEHHVHQTSTLAWMNPGLDVHENPLHPKLTGSPDTGLIDYIVKERLFNFYLNYGCIPFTDEHDLMERMARHNPWPEPIRVYGYDDTWPLAGDLFEAETTCVSRHNMGQIATTGVNNLSYLSRVPRITEPLRQNAAPTEVYDPSKTYVSIVIGDGDNVGDVKGEHYHWFKQRLDLCKKDPSYQGCFPLLWTTSPQALHLAPDMIRWYYNQSYTTGMDYFVLPPSGDLYSYPSLMPPRSQENFVRNTEHDCVLMNTSSTVAWEFFGTWGAALENYFPRYSKNGVVRSAIAVNVPFLFPAYAFGDDFYKILGNLVVFRPNEWRGSSCKPKKNCLTPVEMAAELNGYAPGTVTAIYQTSDGGSNLDTLYELVANLGPHVKVVNHEAIADLAQQRGQPAEGFTKLAQEIEQGVEYIGEEAARFGAVLQKIGNELGRL